jgi:superfamily II DNA or RNA helicase
VRSGDWQRDVQDWVPELFVPTGKDNLWIISYETFTKQMKEAAKGKTFERLAFIFDEIHYVKNPKSERSKAFARVAQSAHQWIGLTATPMSNGWHDTANYAIATKLVKNKTEFYSLYVKTVMKIMGSRHFPQIIGYQNLDNLQAWWAKISKPLSREGNLDLPKFIDKWVPIKLDGGVRKEQQRLVKERTAADGEMLDSHMKLLAALRKNLVATRSDAIRNIFDKTDENIVIFYELNAERDLIKKILAEKEYSDRLVFEQNGHVKNLPKADDPKPTKKAVLLIQYRSGSAGLNLQYASVTVFMSPTYSYQDYHQARGRTDRNGQTKTPVFYHLESLSKVDKAIWSALKSKRDFNEKTVDISDLTQ